MNTLKALASGSSLIAMLAAAATPTMSLGETLAEIEAAAKAEGMLTTIALPHDWCNYGEIIASFKAKYPEITVNELNPDAGSADELEAIRANATNTGPQAPDVVPTVPTKWDDLLKPEYAASFALTGDPRASNQAILAILSAGLSRGAEAGEASGTKGLEFMAELNKAGNFVPVSGKSGTIAQGQTPIVAAWDYNLLAWRDALAGNPPVEVVIPEGPVLAGVYVQAISAYAPHPNAAKLWMEHLFSDEGQNGYVKGYCHTARFNSMVAAGKVPQELLDALPPADAYTRAVFPSVEQQEANKAVVTGQWDSVVGAAVAE